MSKEVRSVCRKAILKALDDQGITIAEFAGRLCQKNNIGRNVTYSFLSYGKSARAETIDAMLIELDLMIIAR